MKLIIIYYLIAQCYRKGLASQLAALRGGREKFQKPRANILDEAVTVRSLSLGNGAEVLIIHKVQQILAAVSQGWVMHKER